MKIHIQGRDYTAALDALEPVVIERRLNQPSVCALWLSLPADGSLPAPVRNQRLMAVGEDNAYFFTGYIVAAPTPVYAGQTAAGARYRYAIAALSDEALLDLLLMPARTTAGGVTTGELLNTLLAASGSTGIAGDESASSALVGYFTSSVGARWSASAALAAQMSRSGYRVVNGALSVAAMQSVKHLLAEGEGSLNPATLRFSSTARRALANDITVCGEREPQAYVTEIFTGDGATLQFDLSHAPFAAPASRAKIITELFDAASIDARLWSLATSNQAIRLGAGGLVMDGGNGLDGQTVLSWRTPIEMGGALLMEAEGVSLSPGSTGIVCGFFVGAETQSQCICGFCATTVDGGVRVQAKICGELSGGVYPLDAAAQYTMRLRVYCPEDIRNTSLFYAYGDEGLTAAGGSSRLAYGRMQLEIQPCVNGVLGMAATLYDGVIPSLPALCKAVPCSSINLIGSMRAFRLSSPGSYWVVSTPAGGGPYSRRIGSTAQAAECHVERSGKLIFYTGYAPAVGEKVSVSYRVSGRAVGRAVNAESQQALIANGLPGPSMWLGTVTAPPARCAEDCRNAAQALVQAASSERALLSGEYTGTQRSFPVDVWPGDALQLSADSLGMDAQVVVRAVKLSYRSSLPDQVEYAVSFANDWAMDLAIQTSEHAPADAWLPAEISPAYAGNLNALVVTAVNGVSVTIDAGVSPPEGGGFEIRRRDYAFMSGEDPDLVMRSSTRTMTFSRFAANDRFYIRMYDGQRPPNYSEFSAAVFLNMPLGS